MLHRVFPLILLAMLLLLSAASCGGTKSPPTSTDLITAFEEDNPSYFCDEVGSKINAFTFTGKYAHNNADWLAGAVEEAYELNSWQPIWQNLKTGQYYDQAEEFIAQLAAADQHGLNSEHFHSASTRALFDSIFLARSYRGKEELAYKVEWDLSMTATILSFMSELRKGQFYDKRWEVPNPIGDLATDLLVNRNDAEAAIKAAAPPFKSYWGLISKITDYEKMVQNGESFEEVNSSKDFRAIAKQLIALNDLEKGTSITAFDETLKAGVAAFQERHGLTSSGELDKGTLKALNRSLQERVQRLKLNADRLRWLPHNMGDEYIWVNIPDYHIEMRSGDDIKLKMKAVVGEPITATPVFMEPMTHVVFSPAWNIPWSIVRDEIFAYAGYGDFAAVLSLSNVEVFRSGEKKDPYALEWKTIIEDKEEMRKYRFRQKPGTGNSLGAVKFIFPNKHAVYLHDTSLKKYFKWEKRALSAGCIRVEKPVELSAYLLKDREGWGADRIKRNMGGSSERRVNLTNDIPVYLYYLTNWVDDNGKLQVRSDVYGHDRKQIAAMKKQGLL